jgi:hypothetical protein
MEGGCYPSGGSECLARELVPIIEKHGGRVLIRATVEEILTQGCSLVLFTLLIDLCFLYHLILYIYKSASYIFNCADN